MIDVSVIAKEHHRRPRSIDGSDKPANISFVQIEPHKHWHTLFGNMNAFQICNHINQLEFKPTDLILVCKFINGSQVKGHGGHNSKNKNKILRAWNFLAKGLNFEQTIEYFNSVWLDPSYHLYIVYLT